MPRIGRLILALGCACCAAGIAGRSLAAEPEYNPIRKYPVAIGPETNRLIVGFQATPSNAVTKTVTVARTARSYRITQAQTSRADVAALAQRVGLSVAKSRQFTPSMHVLFLPKTLYGADVEAALAKLRADPAVKFAAVDGRRYPLLVPTNPLFAPTPGVASGQWYLNTPGPATVEGVATTDYSATDAVSAWNITTGSPGIVIADVDTGILFGHPDLLRAGLGGRLLPGYDFVGEDYNPNSPYNALGTFDIANDGDGWDPDPSDPGDWISQADIDNPNDLFANDSQEPSSWHGTRVVGVFGAITDNTVGTAGMTWGSPSAPGPWALPVRALGKGGGYDSDIISGIEWAAGLAVTNPDGSAVPDNPYPADIINLSLGGDTTPCSGSAYQTPLTDVTNAGVLVVIAAGNASTPGVELPGNCAGVVPGVMAVAGLRNVGTKVGYSSFGPQVSVSAPAGNCINSSGACLRSIDTTTDSGTMGPVAGSGYTYTNETNPNLGTSFATPIVSGIAALMRSVNNNLTPAQLAARIEASANPFPPNTGNIPVCPNLGTAADGLDQCSCPPSGQCGTGMIDAYTAVQAAQKPIGVIVIPTTVGAGSVFDASGSVAACNTSVTPPVPLSIHSYAWTASPASIIVTGANTDKVTVDPAAGTLTLTVKDSAGNVDVETVTLTATSATSTAPRSAGTSATACPTALHVTPISPTVAAAFSPGTVGPSIASTLTFTLNNANGYALTQSNFSDSLPSGLTVASSPAPATTCTGAYARVSATSNTVSLSDANIPVNGSCTVTVSVSGSAVGSYTNSIAANALMTGPAGGNSATASSTLMVTTPNPPTVAEAFSPASVGQNANSTLTITLSNSNAYALTAVGLNHALPSGVTAESSPAVTNTCRGTLPAPTSSVALSGATIPASSACTVTLTVSSGTVGSYKDTIGAGAVTSTPAGSNTAAATATLTVTASGGGGGGALDWLDIMLAAGVLLVGRGQAARRRLGRSSASAPRR
ncbi:MAG: S8 family serine peptidase [Steroidobacteraceae bacterium]